MENIPPSLAKNAVQAFLTSQYDKKTEKEQIQLAKAIEDDDLEKINILKQKLAEAKEKYNLENWMALAATNMANQIKFATHISKGIHPSSKGDCINFINKRPLPKGIVGHQSVPYSKMDASGNAAALPLFSFFDFDLTDELKVMDAIIADDEGFKTALSDDPKLSKKYFQIFKDLLLSKIDNPTTDGYSKQTLWRLKYDDYICIIPLYPSSLSHYIYNKIQHIKYSEEMKAARKSRFSGKSEVSHPYVTLSDIAVVNLGGSNPQGVSRHMSTQRGVNYLLPSLPPIIGQDYSFKLSKSANSIFGKSLAYQARYPIEKVYKVVKDNRNNVNIRDLRKDALDEILRIVFAIADDMRTTLPAGWSKEYGLDRKEKLWLDPKRADLEGEEEFKAERENPSNDWDKQIMHYFARWLNALLQSKFKDIAQDIADPEHFAWAREIEDMRKLYERAGKGVFL